MVEPIDRVLAEVANKVSGAITDLTSLPTQLAGRDRQRLERAVKQLDLLARSLWSQLGIKIPSPTEATRRFLPSTVTGPASLRRWAGGK